ncbi:hypothetical protein HNR60_002672 [Rhodopseudomonas rhenobacensis]|uniref:Uncharacterized protein n=1 Tax=Rhodopseudomonas rhenobacensis TaxID=87461 RepID=A0A7W8DZI7_9BRAD|nr:hypothetical protein [Rhodopseudomonas rhenobacensis]MBB5047915.1 hypothetical protein [Rhodopseudomonas rhenobacensis]
MSIEARPDDSIVRFYESVRRQVELDKVAKFPLASGRRVRDYAASLRAEIDRRRLRAAPIEWPAKD